MNLRKQINNLEEQINNLQKDLLEDALELIKKQREIIEEAKKIIKYNNLIKDKESDPFYYKSHMSDFIEVVEKNINKIQQNND